MQITSLYIYPIKSLSGISLSKSLLTARGLEFDRRWVLVDENNYHITQREMPEMVHLKTIIEHNGIRVSDDRTGNAVLVPFQSEDIPTPKEAIKVWDDVFDALEVSPSISQWFSEVLLKKVKLMFQPESSRRKVDLKYAISGNEIVSNADGYPILMISEASLADLNGRLESPVEMLRFRPNIVISGVKPFEEDALRALNIGETQIIGVKNCARCIMVTNKLDGSERDKEPLKTLAQYRREGKKVLFGRNFVIAKEGEIELGMNIIPAETC